MNRLCVIVLSLVLTFSLAVPVFPAETEHWAAQPMEKWSGLGVIQGDAKTGAIRPDDSMTRAEFTVVLGRIMGYYEDGELAFSDLKPGTWYAGAVSKAAGARIISGYPDGTVRPAEVVNRQEAAVMLCRAFGIEPKNEAADFADWNDVADWAKGAVSALYARGVIEGYDGSFHPWEEVTRAQIISMVDRLAEEVIAESGTVSHDVQGSLVVKAGDVRLENMTIAGDLVIADGVGNGDVYAENVRVLGNIVLRGCGENSFHLLGNLAVAGKIIVTKTTSGMIRVVNESGKTIPMIYVQDGQSGVVISGKTNEVVVACDTPVILEHADVGTVSVTAKDADVTVDENSTVARLDVGSKAEGTELKVDGKVTNLVVNAEIVLDQTGTVSSINVAPGVSQPMDSNGNIVSGNGNGEVSGGTGIPPADMKIDAVRLQLMAPMFGNIPDTADELGVGYSAVTLWQNADGTPASYRWKSDPDAPDTFTANQAYEAVITLAPNAGYAFADDFAVTVTDGMSEPTEYVPVSVTKVGDKQVVLMRYAPTADMDAIISVLADGPAVLSLGETGRIETTVRHNALMDPALFVYQWYTCDENGNGLIPIPGAVGETYTVTSSETAGETTLYYLCKVNAMGETVVSNVVNVPVRDILDVSTVPVPVIGEITFDSHGQDAIKAYYELENLVEYEGVSYTLDVKLHTNRYFTYDADTGTYSSPYSFDLSSSDTIKKVNEGKYNDTIFLGLYEFLADDCEGIAKEEWKEVTLTVQAYYKGTAIEGKCATKTLTKEQPLLTIYNNDLFRDTEMPTSLPFDGKLVINATTGRGIYTPFFLDGVTYEEDYPENFMAFLALSTGNGYYICHGELPYVNEGGVEWRFGISSNIDMTGENLRAQVQYIWNPPDGNWLVISRASCNRIELSHSQG